MFSFILLVNPKKGYYIRNPIKISQYIRLFVMYSVIRKSIMFSEYFLWKWYFSCFKICGTLQILNDVLSFIQNLQFIVFYFYAICVLFKNDLSKRWGNNSKYCFPIWRMCLQWYLNYSIYTYSFYLTLYVYQGEFLKQKFGVKSGLIFFPLYRWNIFRNIIVTRY